MVNIILNSSDRETAEYLAAKDIESRFFSTIPDNCSGNIYIVPNVYLIGGRVKDIDIVIFGELSDCNLQIGNRLITVNSFITTIEVKSHSITSIEYEGTNLYVRYDRSSKKNVTIQSHHQKIALIDFLKNNGFNDAFVTNSIYFNRVHNNEFRRLLPSKVKLNTNVFCEDFTFQDFIISILYQNEDNDNLGNSYTLNNFKSSYSYRSNDLSNLLVNTFATSRNSIGEFTRNKIESIVYEVLNGEISDENLVRGNAGTGKTHFLLIKALRLSEIENKRVILLTFNNILANDIKRIFSYTKFKDSYNEYGFRIDTIHSFVYKMLDIFDLIEPGKDFIDNYPIYVKDLTNYFDSGLLNREEIEQSFSDYYYDLMWDFIFVDEAQDCTIEEKELFVSIVGARNLVVSEGTNQLVRGNKIDWIYKDSTKVKRLKQLLRQKENILYFNKYLLNQLNYDFEISNKKRYSGGEIYIFDSTYLDAFIHSELISNLKSNGCSNYDLMFLVPPCMVNDKSGFTQLNEFRLNGIEIWDGTINSKRKSNITSSQHRLIQYDSSRGIESWITCALNLDDFYEYKWNQFNEDMYDSNSLSSFEEQRVNYVNRWMLIVLTRTIDTLVITFRNPNSRLSQIIKNLSKAHDFIHYELGSQNG